MRGIGRTVFSGNRIEEFQVEDPGRARQHRPQGIAHPRPAFRRTAGAYRRHAGHERQPGLHRRQTGRRRRHGLPVRQGPDRRHPPHRGHGAPPRGRVHPVPPPCHRAGRRRSDARAIRGPLPVLAASERLVDIATPVSFGGFSRATLEAFAPQLRALGLEPRQGVTAGGKIEPGMGNPADLKPGSMISVQLMSGRLQRRRRWHRHLHRWQPHLRLRPPLPRCRLHCAALRPRRGHHPAAHSQYVLQAFHGQGMDGRHQRRTTIPPWPGNWDSARRWCRSPWRSRAGPKPVDSYQMQMVNDPLLSPLLLQMAVYSAIDETERTVGASTIRVTGEIEFQNAAAPIRLNNMFAADNGSAQQVSLSAAVPVAYVMQSGFEPLQLKNVALQHRGLRPEEAVDDRQRLGVAPRSARRRQAAPACYAGRRERRGSHPPGRIPGADRRASRARCTSPWPTPTPPTWRTFARC